MRSLLFVPADSQKKFAKGMTSGADGQRRRKPKSIDRRDREHHQEQRYLDQQKMAVVGFG